jgi:hypothetical protein
MGFLNLELVDPSCKSSNGVVVVENGVARVTMKNAS